MWYTCFLHLEQAGRVHHDPAGVRSELKSGLKGTESYLKQQFDSSLKASAKKSEEFRSKAAAKERQDLEKAIGAQLAQVSTGQLGQVTNSTPQDGVCGII